MTGMRIALAVLMLMANAIGCARLSAQSTTHLAPFDSISNRTGAPYARPVAFQEAAQRASRTGFVMEWLGGMAGSAASFGLGIAFADSCNDDPDDFLNLDCAVNAAFVTVAISIPASALGTYALGEVVNSRPSAVGALIGSVVGVVGGALVISALDSDSSDNDVAIVLGYAAAQGLFSAIGSRIGAALR
jgi:hypothetical protein